MDRAILLHRLVRESNVAEIDHPIHCNRHALGEYEPFKEFLQLGIFRNDRFGSMQAQRHDHREQQHNQVDMTFHECLLNGSVRYGTMSTKLAELFPEGESVV